jgi:hypothetical protein
VALFEQIRRTAGNQALKKAVRHNTRKKKTHNLETAKSIGVLFQVDSEDDYARVHDYTRRLQKEHLEVKALGVVTEKTLMDKVLPVITFDLISDKDVNWFGKPKSGKFDGFVEKRFDICLDLSPSYCTAMKFAAALSKSSFKVGRYHSERVILYDMLLELDDSEAIDKIIQEVDHYLRIIKPG